jgi:SAM-dependent methyltransferase
MKSNEPVDVYYRSGEHLREKHRLAGGKFVHWVLGLMPMWVNARILDAGGGWGRFTWPLIDVHHVDPRNITLADLSSGMLETAAEECAARDIDLKRAACAIQALPFADEQFDVVLANHVLYHLPNIAQGVRELARVLKAGGTLIATTNSDRIVATVIALHYQALDVLGISYVPEKPSPFSMENGGTCLSKCFRRVDQRYFEDERLIYDAAEIRATYETIGRYRMVLARDDVPEALKRQLPDAVEGIARDVIEQEGVLRSPTLMGAFVCHDPLESC